MSIPVDELLFELIEGEAFADAAEVEFATRGLAGDGRAVGMDDQAAFDWIYERLNPGGVLFLTVPAYRWMFSGHDKALNHFRRYSLSEIRNLNHQKMTLISATYFNCLLFPLALLSRLIGMLKGRRDGEARKQSSQLPKAIDRLFYSILCMEAKLINASIAFPWGLSVVVAFKKAG